MSRVALAGILMILAGCAAVAPEAPPEALGIVLVPPSPTARRAATAPLQAPVAALERDAKALDKQATSYVLRRDAKPEVIQQLTTLTTQTHHAVNRAKSRRKPQDVAVARSAADALAAFIQTRTGP